MNQKRPISVVAAVALVPAHTANSPEGTYWQSL